ncbi:MAG: hypothetical protein AVO39_06845 [delta proteobacterium MLS_D]|nr:MAG: hypothetical protein AVO39_06845 [delta proteobacterium MLS_D]
MNGDVTGSFELRNADFEKISRFVYEFCGINLHDGKRELVKARLGKRLRQGEFSSFSDYFKFVMTDEGTDELVEMIDSLSTNLTSFFREPAHFERLTEILKDMATSKKKLTLRFWSAGCSTGEEPYTLAIVVQEALAGRNDDVKILATDISTKVLRKAVTAIYDENKIRNISQPLLRKYFLRGTGSRNGQYRVKSDITEMVRFMRFNLKDSTVFSETFDVIFCRNVMIYFDTPTQQALIDRFYDCLRPGGYLFVGHSEGLTGLKHRFRYIVPSVYRR